MLAAVRASFAERRLAAVDPAPVYRSGFMKKVSSRKHDRFGRVLDSDPVYLIAALALMALLVSFCAVLLVNMNAIDTKTEDLKEHPYAVTVAAGRAETLLMQVRTLDNRLAFARTPETVASVKTCLLYTSPSPRDRQKSRMPSSA